MSELFNSVPDDTASLATSSLATGSAQVDQYWEVTFARPGDGTDGTISAQYSAPRTMLHETQHLTAETAETTGADEAAEELGPRLVFENSDIAWTAFKDIKSSTTGTRSKTTTFTPEDLEEAIFSKVPLSTFTPPETSRLWMCPKPPVSNDIPVYFRSNLPSDGSRKVLTPFVTKTKEHAEYPGVRSWKTKSDAKEHIGSLNVLSKGPAKYHLTVRGTLGRKASNLGSVTVSLNPADCQDDPRMKQAYRKVDNGIWKIEKPPSEGTS